MPVSVVCDRASTSVSVALHEKFSKSLGGATSSSGSSSGSGGFYAGRDSFHNALAASAKASTVDNVDYAEISFVKSIDQLKTKYIVLNKVASGAATLNNGKPMAAKTLNGKNNNNHTMDLTTYAAERSSASTVSSDNYISSNSYEPSSISLSTLTTTTTTTITTSTITTTTTTTTTTPTPSTTINNRQQQIDCSSPIGGRSTNNGNSTSDNNGQLRSQNHGMAPPRVVLYPREKILVGWKNSMRNWQVGSGFLNIGNTCYLNSTLQALMHVPSMANWLANEFDESHLDNCPESDVGCTICSMIRTLVASQSSDSAVRPTHIFSRLKTICKQMVVGRQEDAHEFLRYLVDSMERSYLNHYRNQILDHSSKETNPLSQIFGGYLRSTVRCMDCDYVSVTFQHFQDLSLDIANVDSIEQALDQFFARENLEDMCYKCESCKRKVCASKQFSFEQAPVTLCIQLKRFNPTGVKLGKLIAQRPQLNLTKYVTQKPSHGEQLTYRLVAMITHLGQSPKCGHYTAIGLTSSGTYYEFDDSCVRPLSMNSIMNTNAYIIFYEIEKISSGFINKTKQPITGEKPAAVISTNKTNGTKCSNGHASSDSILRIIGPEMKPSVVLKDMKTMTRTVNYFTCNKNATNGNENNNNNNNSNNNYGTAKNKPLSLLNGNNNNNKEQAANTAKKTVIHFKTAAAANAAVANRSNGNGNGNSGVTRKKGPVPETPLVPYAMETDDDEETTSHETTTKRQSYGGKRARSDAVTSSGDTMPKIKNFHNPFARDTDATSTNNNNNKNNNHNNSTSNGISETTGNPAINNFLQNNSQQSHRALGGLVKSWDGTVSSINGQVNNEKKEQRQREWEEDEENEMDRGRQKKVVTVKTVLNRYYNNGTPGYNPFQEQDNARRWRKPRFFTNHYNRHHYQRNKFKFQRNTNHHTYNNNLANTSTKFQRTNYTSLMSLSKAVSKTPLISSNNKNGSTTATNNNNNKSNNNKS